MLALSIGTVLAVGALCYVLFPLLAGTGRPRPRAAAPPMPSLENEAVAALREIEFDRVTGKLSDGDYEELRGRYTERALAALRAAGTPPEDAAEAAVLAYRLRLRSCARCGPRLEPDAVYCSSCGSFLPGSCGSCGAAVTEAGAAFCTACGRQLAA
jgi:ribosomal protein L40E